MRFIGVLILITLGKCINDEMFMSMFGSGIFLALFGVLCGTLDTYEFIKKMSK